MKLFKFFTSDGSVEIKVDLLSTDLNLNATIMDIKYLITNTSMTSGYTEQQAITNFQRSYPYFAAVQQTVSSGAALKAIATSHNLTLKMYDSSSAANADGGNAVTTLNTHTTTTTTTTTHAPTTTTTTTGA